MIVLATGFNIFDSQTKSIVTKGKSGKILQDQWIQTEQPMSYLGITTVRYLFVPK